MDRGAVLKQLRDARRRRDTSLAKAKQARQEIEPLVVKAVDLDIPVAEVAQGAGLSRQAVYNILRGRT